MLLQVSLRYADPVIVDPGNRAPAPEPLRLVQAFVNTRDIENDVDELTSPAALGRALAEIGVPVDGDADDGGARDGARRPRGAARPHARQQRDPGRRRAGSRRSTAPPRPPATPLGSWNGDARLVPRAPGVDGALGEILAVVHRSMADGTWSRLKGCPRDVCHWAFYDRSRNGSGKWCAMSVCGNRTNTKTYRRRVAAGR